MRSSTLQEVAVVRVKKFSTMCFCCVNVPRVHTPNYQNKTASAQNTRRSRFSKGSNVTDIYGKGQRAPRGFLSCWTKINTKKIIEKKVFYNSEDTTAELRRHWLQKAIRLTRWSLDTLTPDVEAFSPAWSKTHITDGRPLRPKQRGGTSEAIYSFSGWFAPYWIMKVAAVDFCLLQSISRLRCHHTRRWSQTGTWQMARHLRRHDGPHAYVQKFARFLFAFFF